jgi:hypothetical protein
VSLNDSNQGERICEPERLGLLEGAPELVRLQDGGKVEERPWDGRDGDAGVDGALVVGDRRFVWVDTVVWAKSARDCDVDPTARRIADGKQGGRRPMAQHGPRAACQDGGHPNAPLRDRPPPDRIDAAIDDVQPFRLDPSINRAAPQVELEQLVSSNDPMLPVGEFGNRRLPSRRTSTSYFMVDVRLVAHNPMVAAVRRRVGRRA